MTTGCADFSSGKGQLLVAIEVDRRMVLATLLSIQVVIGTRIFVTDREAEHVRTRVARAAVRTGRLVHFLAVGCTIDVCISVQHVLSIFVVIAITICPKCACKFDWSISGSNSKHITTWLEMHRVKLATGGQFEAFVYFLCLVRVEHMQTDTCKASLVRWAPLGGSLHCAALFPVAIAAVWHVWP